MKDVHERGACVQDLRFGRAPDLHVRQTGLVTFVRQPIGFFGGIDVARACCN